MLEPACSKGDLPSATVLVVDDDAPTVRLIQYLLESEGLAVASAADGESALREYARRVPDLILLNVIMPDTDGIWLHDRLRVMGYRGPVVIVTARPDIPELLAELRIKVAGCLVKPLHADELLSTVRGALSGAGRAVAAKLGARNLKEEPA
ncbi:MAG: response regulator transcription factor [Sphingomonadaceae bacterium]